MEVIALSTAIRIWQPKYCTKEVLVAVSKVRPSKNYVYFCADRNWEDLYSFDGEKVINECKVTSNGKIDCYCVPLSWLRNEGELPEKLVSIREEEYEKFKKRNNRKA